MVLGLALSGCSGGEPPAVGPTATTAPAPATYSTDEFVVPLEVELPPPLSPTLADEQAQILTWTSTTNSENRVRFFVPVEVHRPGTAGVPGVPLQPHPPPEDYLPYLMTLADFGVLFTDRSDGTVADRPATFVTVELRGNAPLTGHGYGGALGCPATGMDPADGECFGVQPDYVLRMAVMDRPGPPLLMWARTPRAAPDADFLALLDNLVATLRFR